MILNRLNYLNISLLIFFIFTQVSLAQSISEKKFHSLSGAFGISIEAGGTISKTDYKTSDLDYNVRLLFEYFFMSRSFSTFGLRLFSEGGFIQGQDFSNQIIYPPVSEKFRTGYINIGGGLVFAGRFGNNIPYLSADLAYIFFDPGDGNGNQLPNNQFSVYKKNSLVYSGEAGLKFPFHDSWSFNLGLNLNFTSTDYLDDIKAGSQNDVYIGIFTGISLYLGRNIDSDNDGVDDEIDICLDSSAGSEVDEFGCSEIDLNPSAAVYDTTKDLFIADGIFTDGTLFCFQVEIVKNPHRAEILKNNLYAKGYFSAVVRKNIGNLDWYSVRIGYYNSLERAKVYRDDFFKKLR